MSSKKRVNLIKKDEILIIPGSHRWWIRQKQLYRNVYSL